MKLIITFFAMISVVISVDRVYAQDSTHVAQPAQTTTAATTTTTTAGSTSGTTTAATQAQTENLKKDGYEFWIFTGTNVDLLDGVKVKELYLKGSYLVNLNKENKDNNHFMYLTFGKNRYFSDRDSLMRVPFWVDVPSAKPGDSIKIVQGIYSSLRESVTDNIFGSLDYLHRIEPLSSESQKLFVTVGMYVGLQTIKTTYANKNFLTDTTTYLRKRDTSYVFRPLLSEAKVRQFNYNFSVGLMHILSVDEVNVKTQLTAGLNMFTYPYSRVSNSIHEFINYERQTNAFFQLRIDATVLKPGLSIGFETFVRSGSIPLFNVSLTKVLDIKQLGSLFGKVTTVD